MRRVVSVAAAAALLAGCAAEGATLKIAGEGGGERARILACDGEGGLADALLALTARTRGGLVTVIVRDGLGDARLERHVTPTSGDVELERSVSGAPGEWSLEERRTEDFRGEFSATLRCVA